MTNTANAIEFSPNIDTFVQSRAYRPYTALSGGNNSGKSLTLKNLKYRLGPLAYMMGSNRFYHVYHFSTGIKDANRAANYEYQFQQNLNNREYNYEQNQFDLSNVILNLNDTQRRSLFQLCSELIGNQFTMRKTDEDNDLSMRYIDMDGQNLSVGSSGTRLLMTMLGMCMDETFPIMLIDEPELGLSPRIQLALANFFQDDTRRREYFPHLSQIYVATHSHIFLNRRDLGSNFIVKKDDAQITISPVHDMLEFHNLQFNLLGNSLETMFFPEAIILVEGKSDYAYIRKIIEVHFRDTRITVIQANGDSEIKRRVHGLKEALGDLDKTPLQSRIFAVLDQEHQKSVPTDLEKLGLRPENIVIWERNGIEYYYPADLLSRIFACDESGLESMTIHNDRIVLNGITRTKNELANEVVAY